MKIGFVKDAFGGMPHVMATIDNGRVEVKSITEFGKSIIADFDFDRENIARTIPVGFVFTGFVEKAISAQDSQIEVQTRQKSYTYSDSTRVAKAGGRISAANTSLSKFKNSGDKINAIAFKAKIFNTSSRRGEFFQRITSGKVLFNQRLAKISLNPKFAFSHVEHEAVRDSFGDGFIRKAADKDYGRAGENRRVLRRSRALTNLGGEETAFNGKSVLSRMDMARKDIKHAR